MTYNGIMRTTNFEVHYNDKKSMSKENPPKGDSDSYGMRTSISSL